MTPLLKPPMAYLDKSTGKALPLFGATLSANFARASPELQPTPPESQDFQPGPSKNFRNQEDRNGHGTLEASRGGKGTFLRARGEAVGPGGFPFHLPWTQALASESRSVADWDPILGLMRCGRSRPGHPVQRGACGPSGGPRHRRQGPNQTRSARNRTSALECPVLGDKRT